MGVTGDGRIENRQMEEKGTLRDNYVLQLQPFALYPFFHNRDETVSLRVGERALPWLRLPGNTISPTTTIFHQQNTTQ